MPRRTGKSDWGVRGLDLTALRWFYPLSAVLTFAAFFACGRFYDSFIATGILTGGVFGLLNLGLIILLSVSVLDPIRRNPFVAFLVLGLKVPIIYGILIAMFMGGLIDPMGFAIGLQIFLSGLIAYAVITWIILNRPAMGEGDDITP